MPNPEESKTVVFVIVAEVPIDFFVETRVYGIETRVGPVDQIIDYHATEVSR